MRKFLLTALFACLLAVVSSPAQTSAPSDPWQPLKFLTGTWEARTSDTPGSGTAQAKVTGVYSFAFELNSHVLARHSSSASCKAPADFNCEHSDLLYLYLEGPAGNPVIKAIYFDNEGHTIHYDVTTPAPTTAVFLSDPATPGPQFRLVYERKDNERKEATLSGKFQMKMPGQPEFKSYLEWGGPKK
jgi:hypothetical protein